jgi:hypothetical protein
MKYKEACMRKAAVVVLVLLLSHPLTAGGLDVSLYAWPAFLSSYYEKPSPESGLTMDIYGGMPNYTAGLEVKAAVLDWLLLRVIGKGGFIGGAQMTIMPDMSQTIGGGIYGFDADIMLRFFNSGILRAVLYSGFTLTSGTKTFSDFTQGGVVQVEGDSGYYKFAMFGPQAGLNAEAGPFWGGFVFGADFFWSPLYENHSQVKNTSYKEEFANGFRLGGSVTAGYMISSWKITAGWRHEKIYFNYGDTATHDLDINFSGPCLGGAFTF